MKVKAVIFRPDRTNDVIVLKKKHMDGRVFKHDDSTYFIDPNHQQITWLPIVAKMGKRYYSTYYYFYKVANPIPLADMNAMILGKKFVPIASVNGKNGSGLKDKIEGEKIEVADWKTMTNLGVSEEEMAAIFTPWFYRTIAPTSMKWTEQLALFLMFGIAAGVAYAIFLLTQIQDKLGATP